MEEALDEGTIADLARHLASGAIDLASLTGLDDDELEAAYAKARAFLQAGALAKAMLALAALVLLRPSEFRFYRALGLAMQGAQEYPRAFSVYGMALALRPGDVICSLLRAECAVHIWGGVRGEPALREAMRLAQGETAAIPYVARAQALLKLLSAGGATKKREA